MKNNLQNYGKAHSKNAKKEEYYMEHTPIELSSILVKIVVELLVKIGTVQVPE